ncbi:MAG: right-handed parallel beta-helix repeat-containing protein [Planctomycetota bacterium]|nr:right-handed parallel beta-helix repeat-containing protein [Planctomycetota bacterium]
MARQTSTLLWCSFLLVIFSHQLQGADRLVPTSYPTISAAMDAALNGDRILVAPGTYPGPVGYLGKQVELIGEEGPSVTFLDGSGVLDSIVLIDSVGDGARLSGFTLQNGFGTSCGLPLAICGGAVLVTEGQPTIDNCVFSGNSASRGGGVHAENSSLTMVDCLFVDNFANQGAAVSLKGGNSTISGCVFSGNNSYGWGGGLAADFSWVTLSNCSFSSNTAESGGGFFITESTAFLSDLTIEGNSAVDAGGGGVIDEFSDADLNNVEILNNSARLGGGLAVTHFCDVNVEGCLIQGNTASEYGGGLYSFENFSTYRRNRILDNSAGLKGGGALLRLFADPLLENCLIMGNDAAVAGGGVACIEGVSARLVHCTLDSNTTAGSGGGISAENLSTPVLTNTILSRNAAAIGSQTHDGFQSGYLFNHVVIQDGDVVDPLVLLLDADLDDEGYPGICSAAIDEGTVLAADLPDVDIDGTVRPLGSRRDIGAFEVEGYGHCFVRGDCNYSGDIDLADAIMSLEYLFTFGDVPFCVEACDYVGDGVVGIEDSISTLSYLFLAGPPPGAPYPLPGPATDGSVVESCWMLGV